MTGTMQGILLAAGSSQRFGADKLLHHLPNGQAIAFAAARHLALALPGALAVVNGRNARLVALLEEAGLRTSVCPRADEGMGTSLAWGVEQTADADGWLIALADMPFIAVATIKSVAQAVTTSERIAAPVFEGRRGHPVAFGRIYAKPLIRLGGETGGRDLMRRYANQLVPVSCQDPGVLQDIDSAEQLALYSERAAAA